MKKLGLVIAAVLTLFSACAQQNDASVKSGSDAPLSWQEQYDLGVRYLSEGNYSEAIIAFQTAIEIDPNMAVAYVGRGNAYVRLSEDARSDAGEIAALLQKAETDGLSALEYNEQMPEAYVLLADIYTAMDKSDKALEILRLGYEKTGDAALQERMQTMENWFVVGNKVENESGDDGEGRGIRITNILFDKSMFASGQSTRFIVDVAYNCPDEGSYVLMIGANMMRPDSFRMSDTSYPVSGTGSHRLAIDATPVQWDDDFFGIYVNISDASHPESWKPVDSDIVYFDDAGNVVA